MNNRIEWKISDTPVGYLEAVAAMEQRVGDILAGRAPELVWLLEHPPLYTAGTSAKPSGLLAATFPVYATGRGGEHTYHGPGQLVTYVMLDLKKRNAMDVRSYVQNLEQWIIATLAQFGVEGFVREGRVGVWVNTPSLTLPPDGEREFLSPLPHSGGGLGRGPEVKIAALGIRVRKWVTYHGISINVSPDLSHYSGIVPCGIGGFGVTSLEKMGVTATTDQVSKALRRTSYLVLGT